VLHKFHLATVYIGIIHFTWANCAKRKSFSGIERTKIYSKSPEVIFWEVGVRFQLNSVSWHMAKNPHSYVRAFKIPLSELSHVLIQQLLRLWAEENSHDWFQVEVTDVRSWIHICYRKRTSTRRWTAKCHQELLTSVVTSLTYWTL
jgi:hypothetical protein